jgi:phospholipid N-methyltransferase
MPANEVIAILDGAFAHLRPDAAFYQFTYGPRCPVRRSILERLGLKAARIGGALANMPPASVYRILRRPHLRTPVPGIPVHLHSGDSEAL